MKPEGNEHKESENKQNFIRSGRETLFWSVNAQRNRELGSEEQDSYCEGKRLSTKRSGNFEENGTREKTEKHRRREESSERRGGKNNLSRDIKLLKGDTKYAHLKVLSSKFLSEFMLSKLTLHTGTTHTLNREGSVCWMMWLFPVHSERLSLENKLAESFPLHVYLRRTVEVLDCLPFSRIFFIWYTWRSKGFICNSTKLSTKRCSTKLPSI